jgi:hypothetical protein
LACDAIGNADKLMIVIASLRMLFMRRAPESGGKSQSLRGRLCIIAGNFAALYASGKRREPSAFCAEGIDLRRIDRRQRRKGTTSGRALPFKPRRCWRISGARTARGIANRRHGTGATGNGEAYSRRRLDRRSRGPFVVRAFRCSRLERRIDRVVLVLVNFLLEIRWRRRGKLA